MYYCALVFVEINLFLGFDYATIVQADLMISRYHDFVPETCHVIQILIKF